MTSWETGIHSGRCHLHPESALYSQPSPQGANLIFQTRGPRALAKEMSFPPPAGRRWPSPFQVPACGSQSCEPPSWNPAGPTGWLLLWRGSRRSTAQAVLLPVWLACLCRTRRRQYVPSVAIAQACECSEATGAQKALWRMVAPAGFGSLSRSPEEMMLLEEESL